MRIMSGRTKWLAASGTGVAFVTGWFLQHRVVARASSQVGDFAELGLALPRDVTHHYVETDDGGTIHAVEAGSGPTVVLVHGVTLTCSVWAHQIRDLSDRFRVVAIDQRGHGLSQPGRDGFGEPGMRGRTGLRADGPTGSPGVRRLAQDLQTVLEKLDAQRAVVAGHSLGGMVTLALADALGERDINKRIGAMVLMSTLAGPLLGAPGSQKVARVMAPLSASMLKVADRAGLSAARFKDLRWWSARWAFGAEALPSEIRFTEEMIASTPTATMAGLFPAIALYNLQERLPFIEVPALVVVGTHDRLTPPRFARAMARGLPAAELVELARCGHMPMLERPNEVSRMIAEFTEKQSAR